MKRKINLKVLSLVLVFLSTFSFGQKKINEQSYNLDFLSAQYIGAENENEILLIFKYEPKNKKEFKPIFSMKISYSIGDSDVEKTEIIEKSNHTIAFYGNDIDQQNPDIYKTIKQKIDLNQKEEFGIVVFQLRNITQNYIDKMKFTYGLWEPENESIRIEKSYSIDIGK